LGIPNSAGVPQELARLTMVAGYNSIESVERCFESARGEVAAVIVEPVAANMGVVSPQPGFLKELADLAHRHGALLICDEVITAFRLRFGAISDTLGVEPDLLMLGKIIGGGLPIGAVAGSARLMDLLAPSGPVYQAGTLSGNPLSVRAGLATLKLLREPGTYERLEGLGGRLEDGLNAALLASRQSGCVNRAGSLVTLFLGPGQVRDADEAGKSDAAKFSRFFHAMLERGIYLPPSQFEAMFVSLAHSGENIDATVSAASESLRDLGA
jgi:glutamate-1-semialdehyde 2,1-aminomutase